MNNTRKRKNKTFKYVFNQYCEYKEFHPETSFLDFQKIVLPHFMPAAWQALGKEIIDWKNNGRKR